MKKIRIALAGNPNCGKSTLFNALTGDNQHVGNWPGKTVEQKTGYLRHNDILLEITDLPGTYSLSSYSPEEEIARNFLMQQQPDLVVNVLDASNLDRNLYLTLQVLETGVPTLILMNMSDIASRRGLSIDQKQLSEMLGGIEIVETIAIKQQGLNELIEKMTQAENAVGGLQLDYPAPLAGTLATIQSLLASERSGTKTQLQYAALQLLEGDEKLLQGLSESTQAAIQDCISQCEALLSDDSQIRIADHRYDVIQKITDRVIHRNRKTANLSDRVDQIVTNRYSGIPVFLLVMYFVFNMVQNVSAPYLDWIDSLVNGLIMQSFASLLTWLQAPGWLKAILLDGVLAGVGGVLVFLPGLFIMYILLAVMEQSGYMARAAFVMDRFMNKIGLQGKSFIPMILGFGCNVPAIYATRTIKKRETRILTSLLIPFMSCSARLPVYLIFGLAFFPEHSNLVIFSLYLIGVLIAAGISLLLSRWIFSGDSLSLFVMELPAYRLPSFKAVMQYAYKQSARFVKNAGTIIVAFSIVLWLLLNLPLGVQDSHDSLFGRVSHAIAPVLAPAGFGTWEASGSLVTGLVAKEVVVSTLAQIYHIPQEDRQQQDFNFIDELKQAGRGLGVASASAGKEFLEALTPGFSLFDDTPPAEDTALSRALRTSFTPLSAFSFLVFVLLYVPCAATISAQRQEFGWKWMGVSIMITLIVPWVLSVMIYQGGRLLGLA